jgi:hypothetical protein
MISIQDLEVGQKLKLTGSIIAEVRENPRDGCWIIVRYLEVPGPDVPSNEDEMVSADDVVEVLVTRSP